MLVAIGPRRYDVSHRALVLGVVDGDDPEAAAARHLADGADLLGLGPGARIDADIPVVALDGPELADLGPLYVPSPAPDTDRDDTLAAQALAITRGARVIGTRDVRGTRRVADVLAAILSRT